jgi:threonylcarbamoyladenosine tRNA methylthiotransferase MtaB
MIKEQRNLRAGDIAVITFGCRVNSAESDTIFKLASQTGHGGLVVVNSCAVTAEAVRQARQAIRRGRRDHPDAMIVVTGCAAEVDATAFQAMPEVGAVFGNDAKLQREAWATLPRPAARLSEAKLPAGKPLEPLAAKQRTRAFVQVQNGCDHRCTFCIIPYGRGRSRSISPAAVIDKIKHLVDGGYLEVVLTGIDITSYGQDLPAQPSLGGLVHDILHHVPDLRRLRLSSVDSVEVDDMLLDAFASQPRLMPHVHLSLQSGSNIVLKRMKRRHQRCDAVRFCTELRRRRPEIVFAADLIVGFPTETETDFADSLALIDDCGLAACHVFPFSARPFTPAARMPQLEPSIIKDRAQHLRQRAEEAWTRHLQAQIGRRLLVLAEHGGIARCEDFTKVRHAGAAAGTFCQVTITGSNGKELLALPSLSSCD